MMFRQHALRHYFTVAVFSLITLLANVASADRVNFAKYQEVSASTTSGDYEAGLAVDGIVSNFNSFRTTNTTNPQWLEVTFPRTVTVASAHVYLGTNADTATGLASFKFQSFDGSAWVDVPGSAVTGNTAVECSVIFNSAVTSSRFRLYTDDDGSRTIRELALFPPNVVSSVEQGYPIGTDVRLSMAFKRPTLASSISSSGYAKLAVDGYVDDASRWLCANVSGHTLEVDLLDTNVLGSAHLYSGFGTGSALGSFVLEYWDGAAWVAIPGATITGNTSTALVIPFSSSVTTSRIRLRTTAASFARVRELLIFPPRAGGYPLGQDVEITPPPTAKWDDLSDSTYVLKNGGPDNRLALVNGTVVYESPSTPAASIEWQLLLNYRDGSCRVRHAATGGCLALGNISRAGNTPVVVETYSGMPHQDWFLDFTTATQFRLINVYSGLALNPVGSNWARGTAMIVTTPGSGVLQLWNTSLRDYHPKKGIGGNNYDGKNKLSGSWSYNWGRASTMVFPFDHTYNPMQWGNSNFTHGDPKGPLDLARNDLQSTAKAAHLMGFNEPDQATQSNVTVESAVARWPRLEAMEAPLVGPCPANTFAGWQDDFTTQVDALGYRRDYTPYHAYGSPNATSVIDDLEQAYIQFGRPIWLTEFSVVDWDGTGNWTNASNYNFLAEFMWRAESLTWLKRYALFQFTEGGSNDLPTSPKSNTWRQDGSMTPFGELYAGWDGVTSVVSAKAYHVHNRGEYERLRNPGTASTAALVDPSNSRLGSQWFLTPGTTAGTYRIISTRDGRPLRSSGTAVDIGTRGLTTTAVEWNLVADQNGWYFIEYTASNKRLQANANGTFSMVADTITTDAVKWRFVVPASPDSTNSTPSAIPQHVVTFEDTSKAFTLEGGDVDGNALTFTIVTPPANGTLSGTAPNLTYTPDANFNGDDSFTFRVSDGTLDSAPATVTIRVTEVNDAPVATPQSVTMSEDGANKTITLAGTDIDGDSLTYTVVAGPTNGALGGTSRNRTYTPTGNYNGTDSFTFRVNDGTVNSATATVTITITAVNDAPVLAAIPAQSVNESAPLAFTASATDVDLPANTLTYSLSGAPAGAAIHPTTGVFTWTPTDAQGPASYSFTASVSDGTLTSSRSVAVTVYGILGNPGDDTDGDGVANLLEWALHLDPVKPDTFTPILDTTAPGFFYTYTRRKNTNAIFQVEWADTLGGTWSTVGVGSSSVTSQTTTSETIAVPIPINTSGRFYRVKVTRP